MIAEPLGANGNYLGALAFTALLGFIFTAPLALLCGGLLCLLIRGRDWQEGTTALFIAAGSLAGLLFFPLFALYVDGRLPELFFEPTLVMVLAGIFGALAYRFVMPPIERRVVKPGAEHES